MPKTIEKKASAFTKLIHIPVVTAIAIVVEAIADDELIRNLKTSVFQLKGFTKSLRLEKQGGYLNAGRLQLFKFGK